MGSYTDNLFKKNRHVPDYVRKELATRKFRESRGDTTSNPSSNKKSNVRLTGCWVRRDGVLKEGFKSHAEVRHLFKDGNDPYTRVPGDEEGFTTSDGQYVSRRQALRIGVESGQCRYQERELLSSDINW